MNDVLRSVVGFWIRVHPVSVVLLTPVFSILALASVSLVSAQAAEVRISELQCNNNPEVVTIENQGGAPQDLTGWTLRSDPVATESFELSAIGTLGSGVSVFVQSGPSAQGSYVWATTFVLRDSDAADFARIVNADGTVVHEVKCGAASATATAAATPQPTPTAAPATAPVDVVPEGGGPPGTRSWQSGGLMLAGGAWLLAAVFGILVLSRLRSGRAQPLIASTVETLSPAILPRPAAPGYDRWLYLFLVLVLAAIAGWSSGSHDQPPPR